MKLTPLARSFFRKIFLNQFIPAALTSDLKNHEKLSLFTAVYTAYIVIYVIRLNTMHIVFKKDTEIDQ